MPTETTFPLIPTATGGGAAAFEVGEGLAPAAFADFIGIGLLTPFRRGPNDFAAAGGVAFIQSMIGQVLGTRSDSDFTQGELPWRTEFGSILHHLRHQNNTLLLAELARVHVADALARWIPQIRLKDVEVSRKAGPDAGSETNVLQLRILYDIIGVNRPGNEVLIPNVEQSISLAA